MKDTVLNFSNLRSGAKHYSVLSDRVLFARKSVGYFYEIYIS